MDLQVRLLARPDGAAAFVLTDAEGVMLPMQVGLDIFQLGGEAPEITVRITVDGERVRLTNALATAGETPAAAVPAGDAPDDGGGPTVVPIGRGRKPSR